MKFQFESLTELMAMSGHGPYVWACYGITLVALLYLVISPLRRRKLLFEQLKRQQRIAAHERAGQNTVENQES
ncbi:heme exporter protein CcmD [Pseudomaricurvus alkylphenolicus]|nr:heme exporter protein CcmD [Pseudomaricurvus alkylphenolicus]